MHTEHPIAAKRHMDQVSWPGKSGHGCGNHRVRRPGDATACGQGDCGGAFGGIRCGISWAALILIGEDPFEVERLWHTMYMGSVYYGRRGAVMQVISGIDIALWDIVGRAVGQPVYKLLGAGYRDTVTAYASTLFRSTTEGMADAARWYLDQGFKAVKFGWECSAKTGSEMSNWWRRREEHLANAPTC